MEEVDEEDGSSNEIQDDSNDSSEEERRVARKGRKPRTKTEKLGGIQAAFQCMYKHDGAHGANPNERTIEVVSKLSRPWIRKSG